MLKIRTGATRLSLLLILAALLGSIPAALASSTPAAAQSVFVAPRAAVLTVNPVSATAGTTVTLTGSGYNAATATFTPTVTFAFTDANGTRTTLPQTATTSTAGGFSAAVAVPVTVANGPAQFSATDISGTAATASFDVRPAATRIGAAPSSGVPGSTTTITGTGFAANQPITLTSTQSSVVTVLSSGAVTTTSSGAFTTTVVVPGAAGAGATTITAQDRDNNSAATPFTVVRNGAPTVGVSPATVNPGQTVTVTGTNFAASQPITVTFAQSNTVSTLISGTATTDVSGRFTTTVTIPTTAITGTATLTATDRSGNAGATALNVLFPFNKSNGPTTLYFAEGYTGLAATNGKATFDETLSILNANPFTATATITYLIQDGSPVQVTRDITPNSTLRESVNGDIGNDKIAAAIVSSDSRLTAERIIRRGAASGTTLDANSSVGNPNLGTTFYFAEGYTGISFQEYLTVANPGNTDAKVTVTYAPEASSSTGAPSETFTVPAKGRATRNIRRDTLTISNKSVGMIVTSDQPIMAERVLYFGDGSGSAKYGSTAKAGLQTVANQYLFAYGSAGGTGLTQQQGDQSFVTVLNPGTSPISATVVAQFFDATGNSLGTASIAVAPGTRQTINANSVVHNTASVYSTLLTSTSPFVAEKPQYYGGSPNVGTHPGVAPSGAPAGVTSAAFPDLSLTDPAGAAQQQTVFLYNPTTAAITVTATYYSANGSKSVVYPVSAKSIATVNVNTDAAGLPAGSLGATFAVTSAGANDSFVATAIANSADHRSYTGTQGSLPAR